MTKDEYSLDNNWWETIDETNAREYACRGIISHEFADYVEEVLKEEKINGTNANGTYEIVAITNKKG